MTDLEVDRMTVEEGLNHLRLLLPRVMKGLRRGSNSLPADLRATLQSSAFSGRHMLVLMHLAESDGLTVSGLSERLGVTLPTVSVVIHQLASYGLVERTDDPADRRRAIVRIDPLHREWVDAMLAQLTEPLRRTLVRLQPMERAVFVKALKILAEESGSSAELVSSCREDEEMH